MRNDTLPDRCILSWRIAHLVIDISYDKILARTPQRDSYKHFAQLKLAQQPFLNPGRAQLFGVWACTSLIRSNSKGLILSGPPAIQLLLGYVG